MNVKRALLDRIDGAADGFPLYLPRLDVYYAHNRSNGTLPAAWRGKTLEEIRADLNVGVHAVIPEYLSGAGEADSHHRALGFSNHPEFPWRADFSAVDYAVEHAEPTSLRVRYFLPDGEITTAIEYGDAFFATGASIPTVLEHAVKTPDDYRRLARLFDRVRILPQPEGYRRFHDRVGDRGLAVAPISLAAGPVAHIMRDLQRPDLFFLDRYDDPEAVLACAEALRRLHDEMLDRALETPAETIIYGANYDSTITYPPLFAEHFKPCLAAAAARAHAAGKRLLTHIDGENQGLVEHYLESGFDIADSVCPAPMTRLTLAEYRREFASRITIWGGIPSVLMLSSFCDFEAFKRRIDAMLEEDRPYDRLIYSVADTMPPHAEYDRIRYLSDAMAVPSLRRWT